jgi:hypothetical protein
MAAAMASGAAGMRMAVPSGEKEAVEESMRRFFDARRRCRARCVCLCIRGAQAAQYVARC